MSRHVPTGVVTEAERQQLLSYQARIDGLNGKLGDAREELDQAERDEEVRQAVEEALEEAQRQQERDPGDQGGAVGRNGRF